MLQAYEMQQVDAWQRSREIAYMIYLTATSEKDRREIHELWPLRGDMAEARDRKAAMIERYKKMGLLT